MRTYQEIMDEVHRTLEHDGMTFRRLHEELKEINPKGGLPLWQRYPNLPFWVSVAALGVATTTVLLRLLL